MKGAHSNQIAPVTDMEAACAVPATSQRNKHSVSYADSSALAGKGVLVGVTSKAARLHITKLSYLLTGKPRDGERLFHLYGSDDRDGLLAPTELRQGFNGWTCLSLSSDGLDQLVHFIFLYADKDGDGLLNLTEWIQVFQVMSKVHDKFKAGDLDEEAHIGLSGVVAIARDLGLKLTDKDLYHFVDVNFRFVDTSLFEVLLSSREVKEQRGAEHRRRDRRLHRNGGCG